MQTRGRVGRRASGQDRGAVLTGVLVLTFALMGVAALAALSGYTNLLTASNLRAATGAKSNAENSINEAIYRLSLPNTDAAAIVPTLTDPDWNVGIYYTSGDNNPADHSLSTIQVAGDWPDDHAAGVPAVTLQFKRDEDGNVIFYNRAIANAMTPPFLTVGLPSPVGPIVDSVYELLCEMPSILGVQVGGVLGLCEPEVAVAGYPVVQIRATGFDARGARRELVAEAARSIAYTPLAPLNVGGTVNLNNTGFIDGVNHDHRIVLTAAAGSAAIYGDERAETTSNMALLGLVPGLAIKDSPDDHNLWTALPLLAPVWHGVANASLVLFFELTPNYTSFPRLYNLQISSTDHTAAWVGVSQLTNALTDSLALPGVAGLVPPANIGIWTGINYGYQSPIALSATGTVANPPIPQAPEGILALDATLWTQGVFSWRINNRATNLVTTMPAVNTITECDPDVTGEPPPALVCRPSAMTTLPTLNNYLGINEVTFASLIGNPDTTLAELNANQAPLGVTYVNGNYTLGSSVPSPGTNDFGTIYIAGNLTVEGTHTFKGLIFVDGNITINTGAHLAVLGAIFARGNYTHVGTGRTTLLYSREAALRGVSHAHPWRVLSWVDTAMLQ